MLTMTELGFDNAARVQAEAPRNARMINFVANEVAPIAPIRIGEAPKVGDTVYNVRGMIPGILRSIDGKDASVEFKLKPKDGGIQELWVRLEDIKSTPWTKEESATYFEHRKMESVRVQIQEKAAVKAFEMREALAKQFCR